ncbi:MAG: hypothetical protein ACTHZ9_01200 [Leucobacter sp.]
MSGLLLTLSIVGGLAVIGFILFVIMGAATGWKSVGARRVLSIAFVLAIVCAVLGVVIAITGG